MSCQLEVNESAAMYTTMSSMPTSSVSFTGASFSSFSLNMTTPAVTPTATAYSAALYLLPETA